MSKTSCMRSTCNPVSGPDVEKGLPSKHLDLCVDHLRIATSFQRPQRQGSTVPATLSRLQLPLGRCMQCPCQLPTRHSLHGQKVFQPASTRPVRRKAARTQAVAVTQVPTSLSTSRYVAKSLCWQSQEVFGCCLTESTFHMKYLVLPCTKPFSSSARQQTCSTCRVWEAAYEQLQMEKGVCNLIQKYSPEAVRERALSSPTASFQILVSFHRCFCESLPCKAPNSGTPYCRCVVSS